jgi:ABC-type phosphate transport system substrate-binding protein
MGDSRHRPSWLLVRIAFYLLVIVVVFMLRVPGFKQTGGGIGFRLATESDTVKTIALAGLDLAPELIPVLVSDYEWQFRELRVRAEPGGTARALEAMVNGRAAVGLMYRRPTREEKAIVMSAVNDSVLCFPIALGGIAVLANDRAGLDSLEVADLRRALRGESLAGFERIYAPDPNQGLWDAFRSCLGFGADAAVPDSVTFLADETAVVNAVLADPRSIGITSTLSLPDTVMSTGVHAVAIRADGKPNAALPEYTKIGYGEYPLFHYLYAACLANGSVRGAMFVTHLTSDRGQRQVERAGFLPARHTARAIVLTRQPSAGNGSKEDQ